MGLTKYLIPFILGALTLISCNSEPSLQEYLVAKQSDNNFVKMDLATSMFLTDKNSLSDDQKKTLSTVKKVNIVAFTKDDDNAVKMETERDVALKILADEKYEDLGTFNSNGMKIRLSYVGKNEERIDEVILYANMKDKGFGIARLLGDDMNPGDMLNMLMNLDMSTINDAPFKEVAEIFSE